jgi:hypothetical protein
MNDHPVNDHPVGHEQSDANIRAVTRFGISIAVLCVVAALAMLLLFRFLQARPEPAVPELAEHREIPPAPRLQVKPTTDLDRMRAAENRVLESYGWIDQPSGAVRIPIERAIALLAERGLPTRPETKDEAKK